MEKIELNRIKYLTKKEIGDVRSRGNEVFKIAKQKEEKKKKRCLKLRKNRQKWQINDRPRPKNKERYIYNNYYIHNKINVAVGIYDKCFN